MSNRSSQKPKRRPRGSSPKVLSQITTTNEKQRQKSSSIENIEEEVENEIQNNQMKMSQSGKTKSKDSQKRAKKEAQDIKETSDQEMIDEEASQPMQASTTEEAQATTARAMMKRKRGNTKGSHQGSITKINLQSQILKHDQNEAGRRRIKFPGIKTENSNNQVCQACFQMVRYPQTEEEEQKADDEEEEQSSAKEERKAKQQDKMTSVDNQQSKDAKLLYNLVYCEECHVPVHWGCLGEKHQLQEFVKERVTYYLFKCDRCAQGTTKQQHVKCHICNMENGLMKKCSIINKSTSEGADQDESLFVHQICATSFPEVFVLADTSEMAFKKINTGKESLPEHQSHHNKKKGGSGSCQFCNNDGGLLLKCTHDDGCENRAHAYCAMNYLKDYMYESNISSEALDVEEKYKNKWTYQLFLNQEGHPTIQSLCFEHQNLQFCFCKDFGESNNMTLCEFCYVWFHQDCLGQEEVDMYKDKTYRCQKCVLWKNHLQNHLIDVILNKKDTTELMDTKRTVLLFEYLVDKEMKYRNAELKIFDQTILAKAWSSISYMLMQRPCNIVLFKKQQEDMNEGQMDVDQGQSKKQQDIKKFKMNAKTVAEFLEEMTDEMVADKNIVSDVKDKAQLVKTLRDCLPDVLSSQHDIKKLRDYVKNMREYENIDFSYEIEKTEDKIRLIQETQAIV